MVNQLYELKVTDRQSFSYWISALVERVILFVKHQKKLRERNHILRYKFNCWLFFKIHV